MKTPRVWTWTFLPCPQPKLSFMPSSQKSRKISRKIREPQSQRGACSWSILVFVFLSMLLTCCVACSFLPTRISAPWGQKLYLLFIFVVPHLPLAYYLCVAVGSYMFAKFQLKKFTLNYKSLDYSVFRVISFSEWKGEMSWVVLDKQRNADISV